MGAKINTAVILGGTSEHGLFRAKSMINAFDRIILVDDSKHALHAAVETLADVSYSDQIVTIQVDFSKNSELAKMACSIKYKYGGASQIIDCRDDIDKANHPMLEDELMIGAYI